MKRQEKKAAEEKEKRKCSSMTKNADLLENLKRARKVGKTWIQVRPSAYFLAPRDLRAAKKHQNFASLQ